MPDPHENANDSRTRLTLLWTQAQPVVMAFIRSMVPNAADAEDVLQRTAYDIATSFDDYDPQRPFVAWAIGIAKYKVLEYRRDAGRQREVFNDAALEHLAVAYADRADAMSDHARALRDCLNKLSDKARLLIEMRYMQNLRPATIAERIGTTANTVSNALSRTREALRDCIERAQRRQELS